jgi:hypothetical protein
LSRAFCAGLAELQTGRGPQWFENGDFWRDLDPFSAGRFSASHEQVEQECVRHKNKACELKFGKLD